MEVREIANLHEYEENSKVRTITKEAYDQLKMDLLKDGQLDNLLVTTNNIVLGGNHRLKAMRDLGFSKANCDIIDFQHEPEGWYAILNGEPQRTHFHPSRESAMFYYSIKDNNGYATYNKEALLTYVDMYSIPYEDVRVYYADPVTLEKIEEQVKMENIEKTELEDKEKKYTLIIQLNNEIEQQEHYQKLVEMGYIVIKK